MKMTNAMKIIPLSQVNIDEILLSLGQGQTLVYPTETCYGLGCDPTSSEAVEKIFHIKKRPENKPLLLVFPNVDMVLEYIEWNPTLEEIARKYWPGALTLVAPLKASAPLARQIRGADETVAFRVSSHHFVTELTSRFGKPLVSTSANLAGEENPYDIEAVKKNFAKEIFQPDLIIDGGELPVRPPSTILTLEDGKIKILRQGEVVIEHE